LTGIPYSFTVHGPEEFDSPIALRLKDKAADAQAVIAISSFGRSQLMRWLRLEDWPKIRVVRCGVDAAFLAAAQHVWANTEAFCCVARLSAQKGLPLLLDACAILAAEGRTFHLSIIGDGEMREDLEQQVARLGLASKISFLGARDAQSVRDLLAQSRFFVLPSFAEGLPVVLMEALALSKPVVTTAVAGIPELVDSACGWMVPAGDSDALARAMADALDASDEQLRLMGTEGRRRICQWHDASKNARELLLVFADRGQASERCS
jgi:glycosyltransferase involved in cell wall biosynthesis